MSHRRVGMALGSWVLGWSLACSAPYSVLEEDEPCDQVASAISAVTFQCSGDGDLANARYHAFQRQTRCANTWASSADVEPSFDCAVAVADTPCRDEREYGDDFAQWLTADPACDGLFRFTGSAADTGDTGVGP